ncbi:MAG: copper resistance protein CopC, partial [Caldilineaceae bacterium]|nr:copper resistance protein CopC [Caldilineaceae bacterium]
MVSFLVAGSIWLSATQHAAAHALLVRSLPAANEELTSMPAQIELWFSEPLEATVSRAWVVDAAGNELPGGGSNVDAADAAHLTLQPPDLAPGIYTVVYRTLSQADGHEWLGSFPLTLLNPDGTRPAGPSNSPASAAGRATNKALPTPLEAFSRWLSLMGALLLFGAMGMGWIVSAAARTAQFQQVTTRLRKWGMLAGSAALLMGGWLQLGALQLALGGESWGTLLLSTRSGNLLLIRDGLTAAVLLWGWFTTADQPSHGPDETPKRRNVDIGLIMQMAIGVAILATFAMGSHASAVTGRNWAMLGDLIHFAAAAIWMGGLLLLAILLWQMRNSLTPDNAAALRQTVQRFSTTAMLAVFVLICSGLFSSVVQLPALNLLWRSAYGWL